MSAIEQIKSKQIQTAPATANAAAQTNPSETTSSEKKNAKELSNGGKIALSAMGLATVGALVYFATKGKTGKKIIEKTEEVSEQLLNNTNIDKEHFYLGNIKTLFEKHKININEEDAFGLLCNDIERKTKLESFESFLKHDTVDGLLEEYKLFLNNSLEVPITSDVKDGSRILSYGIKATILNMKKPFDESLTNEQNVKYILESTFQKGKDFVNNSFGDRFKKLEELNKNKSPDLQDYFATLKNDLAFHLRILEK